MTMALPTAPAATDLRVLTHDTPAGALTTIVTSHPDDAAGEVVVAAGFTTAEVLLGRLAGAPVMPDGSPAAAGPAAAGPAVAAGDASVPVAQAIDRWLAGDLTATAALRLRQQGTPFQHRVWQALADVPAGSTATYTQLAAAVDRPAAHRAVGSACGRNLIAPWVPCHRAVRTDGGLGGYAWGLDAKRWLLAHERGDG